MSLETKTASLEIKGRKRGVIRNLGPAFITSALVLGPGSITLSLKIGAIHGTQLVWALVIAVLFMMVFTEMSTRIGLAANASFIQVVKDRWGRWAGLLIGLGAFLVTSSFQAGNAIGTGIAVSTMTGMNSSVWIVVMTLIGAGLLFTKQFYAILEKMMLVLVLVMLLSFMITVILIKPTISSIFSGFVPALPSGSMGLVIAMFATTFSIVGAIYQSYLVKEKGWTLSEAESGVRDSYLGIFILGFISFLIMIAASAILKPKGLVVNDASEMGLALEPLFGSWSTMIFMLGLFGASFSSLMGNATIGGAMLSDGLGLGSKLSKMSVRSLIILVMVFGSAIGVIFGKAPVNLIVFAQAITIVIVPGIAIAILVIANDRKIMGSLKNTTWKNTIGILGLLVLLYLAFNNLKNIFF
ncbi:MAG TPA: Nramp family divalent metal transporter [Bacillaceae bacterium]